MCSTPLLIDGIQVSCGKCNQCAATYKNSWIARAMAEKASMPCAYAFTLTYADKRGEAPLGAKVFRYKDVQNFWMRLRDHGKRKYGKEFEVRYVVVGELGSKFRRTHYHGVLFTSHPIQELGHYQAAKSKGFAYKRRLEWSIWGHGFVEFQEADRKGIAYTIKYVLKGRMNLRTAVNTAREGKTEWLASSYLWCSKKPPIGATWLWGKLHDLYNKRMCPPSLRIRVPGGGDWYISGDMQEKVCAWLHQANASHRIRYGQDLAGWQTLLDSVSDDLVNQDTGEVYARKPREILENGQIEEYEDVQGQDPDAWDAEYRARQERQRPIWAARFAVSKCGNIKPCEACRNSISGYRSADIDQEYLLRYEEYAARYPKGRQETNDQHKQRFEEFWRTRLRPSRGCAIRNDELLQDQFRRLVPLEKARHGVQHKRAIGKALQSQA